MKLYLLDREFIVQTDHCPLRDIHKKALNNRRVDRISLVLQQYNIKEIRHVSGKCNCMADYLSGFPRQVEDDDEFLESDFGIIPAIKNDVDAIQVDKNKSIIPSFISAVTTRAQVKAQAQTQQIQSNNDSKWLNHELIRDDPRQQEAGHDFDITKIAEAQKGDKLHQKNFLEINKNPMNCFYVLENDILYKINNRGIFQQKLIYIFQFQ
ncbi:unnamed protein product [Rotaria magnacalcarata]|uniref:Reverse transcriptase RNase H-like domain-containing protein n=1 Tax=Rotaria magnacalcarata TaxID=392030 RepID=A0A816NX23_9BILA|nr:unnamed protein product [Rotaria magnacalcarata]